MNIKEQWIDKKAEDFRYATNGKYCYQAGANEMKELLLIACEALTTAHKNACGCCSSDDLVEGHCHEALNKIQEKLREALNGLE